MQLSPYLMFSGNCEQAFRFYERVLKGKIVNMLPHEGTPAESQVPPEWRKKIIHARMTVGNYTLMASDAPPGRQAKPQGFSLNYGTDTPEDAERVFGALADNGAVTMPMSETFFAHKFGMCTDQFGIPWMVVCEKKM